MTTFPTPQGPTFWRTSSSATPAIARPSPLPSKAPSTHRPQPPITRVTTLDEQVAAPSPTSASSRNSPPSSACSPSSSCIGIYGLMSYMVSAAPSNRHPHGPRRVTRQCPLACYARDTSPRRYRSRHRRPRHPRRPPSSPTCSLAFKAPTPSRSSAQSPPCFSSASSPATSPPAAPRK